MGKKRFTIKKSGKGLFYSDGDYSIDNTIQFVIETVEYKLNQLNDENEQLKKQILEVEKDNEKLEEITSQFKVGDIVNLKSANEVIDDQRREIKLLKEENKELKSLIKNMGELGGFNKHMIRTICDTNGR